MAQPKTRRLVTEAALEGVIGALPTPQKGDPGDSAYQVARAAGYGGTQTQWLASLKGDAGASAYAVAQAAGYTGTQAQWLASLKGDPGTGSAPVVTRAFRSSSTGTRLHAVQDVTTGPVSADLTSADVMVDPSVRYQEMLGVGAAVTEASAWLLMTTLDVERRTALLRELFAPDQGNLSAVRVSIGSNDFVYQDFYTYDAGASDPAMDNFSVGTGTPGTATATKDHRFIVPVLQEIMRINPAVKIIASPWSPPAWMKTNGSILAGGIVASAANFTAYAKYFVKFLQTYRGLGIPVAALTVQNEPGYVNAERPTCDWTAAQLADFTGNYLGPELDAARFGDVAIVAHDYNWNDPDKAVAAASGPAAPYVRAVGWHGYGGTVDAQTLVQRRLSRPVETWFTEWRSLLSESLAVTMDGMVGRIAIESVTRGTSFITLWNLALDQNGQPTRNSPGRRGVLTLSTAQPGLVTRNPEYVALRHLAQHLRPGAVRVRATSRNAAVAFRNPDGSVVTLVYTGTTAQTIRVVHDGKQTTLNLGARECATVITGREDRLNLSVPPAYSAVLAGSQPPPIGPIDPTVPPSQIGTTPTTPADTTAPTAPTGFTATRTGDTTATLAWTASTDAQGVTGYRLVRTSRSSGTVVTTDNISGTSLAVTALNAASIYDYVLTAVDAAGNRSGTATAVLPTYTAPPPSGALGIDAVTPSATATNQEVNRFTHTTGTDVGRAVVLVATGVPHTTLDPAVRVTWGGDNMTEVTAARAASTGGVSSGHNRAVRVFTLDNPAPGAATVVVTVPARVDTGSMSSHAAAAVTLKGASTLGTPAVAATTTTTSTQLSATTAAAVGGLVLALASVRDTVPPTPGAGQTSIAATLAGTNTALLVTTQPTGAAAVSSSTMATAGQHALVALPVLPGSPPPSTEVTSPPAGTVTARTVTIEGTWA